MKCLNINSVEYQNLKQVSGIPDRIFNLACAQFQEEHNRLPRLDELQGSDSSKYLTEQLNVTKNNTVDTNKLLEYTGTNSVEEAVININNKHLDAQLRAINLGNKTIVDIKQRPSISYKNIDTIYNPDEIISPIPLIQGLNDLRELYGYNFKEVNQWELEQKEWSHLIPSEKNVKAFIYNGDIYINVDKMTADSKIHEMLHLLLGTVRFSNPELYENLLGSVMQVENIQTILQAKYPNRTQNDALEEFFVTELSKHLSGMNSKLSNLSKEQLYEINYNVKRTLDTLLFGDYSTKTIPEDQLYTATYKQVAKGVNSSKLTSNFKGDLFDGSELHRKLNNTKSELLRKGQLTEQCD